MPLLYPRPDWLRAPVARGPRLYSKIRPPAGYQRSLQLLLEIQRQAPPLPVKSGLMLGLGERQEEILPVLKDLRAGGVESGPLVRSSYHAAEQFEEGYNA